MAVNIVEKIDDKVKIRAILVSVSNKSGLDTFIPALLDLNPEISLYSTGGTYSHLEKLLGRDSNNLFRVSDYTGQPEMQGGLVKTLDYKIYLGLLSETYNEVHAEDLKRVKAAAFDMVVVNLYPFKQTIEKPGVTPEEARANIDIGGPCMVRAAAKNFLRVASVTDPEDYPGLLTELKSLDCSLALATRYNLACKAFAHTASYDSAIRDYLMGQKIDTVKGVYSI